MFFQRLSAFSPLSHYNHFNTKSTFQIQTQTESTLNTNLIGGAGNYGSNVNKNNGVILLHQGQYNSLRSGFGSSNTSLHGNVNILLGGAMLSVVIIILCIACYCCHRNIKKRTESAYRQRWLETDDNMEIYSVEQCYESAGLFMTSNDHIPTLSHEPPPSYDAVILNEIANRASPPPGYRSTNSIDNSNEGFLSEMPIRKQYNYEDECTRISTNRTLRSLQSVCSLERAHNQSMQLDEINSIETSSNSSDQNSFYTNNNGQNFSINQKIKNSNDRTFYSKLKSNSSSVDSGLDILVNALNQQQQNESSTSEYNSDISPISHSVPTTSYNRENYNDNNQNQLNIENNLMDLLIHEEQNYLNNNNAVENLADDDNLSTENNNNCLSESNNINNNNVNLDCINDNGIVRLDMSQIIDTTGLPTYEAALKLESSGYV